MTRHVTQVGAPTARLVELVKLFRSGRQQTIKQASMALDCEAEKIRPVIYALHDSGVIRISGWMRGSTTGPLWAIYAWSDEFGAADEPKPAHVKKRQAAEVAA